MNKLPGGTDINVQERNNACTLFNNYEYENVVLHQIHFMAELLQIH